MVPGEVIQALRALLAAGRVTEHLAELRAALRTATPGNVQGNALTKEERAALRQALAAYAWREAMPDLKNRDLTAAKALERLLVTFDVTAEDAEPPPPEKPIPQADKPRSHGPTITKHLSNYTLGARQLVQRAQALADMRKHREVTELHLLAICLDEPTIEAAFVQVGSDPSKARRALEQELATLRKSAEDAYLSAGMTALVDRIEARAKGREVTILDVLVATLADPPRGSLAELDRRGLSSAEAVAIRRVIAAGDLGRIQSHPSVGTVGTTN